MTTEGGTDNGLSYESLLRRGGFHPSELSPRIAKMCPGEVLDAGVCPDRKTRARITQLVFAQRSYVRTHSPHRFAVRVRNGRIFVLCLKPEDYPLVMERKA